MGKLAWHDLAHLVALTSGTYLLWSSIWGIFYRKFFWDMIGGTLGPHGLIPPPSSAFFIDIIVKAPVLQILNIILGLLTIAIEWPMPGFANTAFQRSHIGKSGFYFLCSFFAILVYQSVDSAGFYFVAIGMYLKAHSLGEVGPTPLNQNFRSSPV